MAGASSGPDSTKVVHTFAKKRGEKVQVSVDVFKGRKMLNIRTYYLPEHAPDESDQHWLPAKQGIALAAEKLDDLEAAVKALRAEIGGTPKV